MEALQRQDKDEASSIALSLEEIGASIEATRDDEPSSGKLVQSMIANLLKATHLLEARREVDPQKVNEAELALKKAEGEMKMLAAGVHPELKQTFEQSLVEFGAAAMIARSDDLEITRERALEEINRGLGR